MNIELTKPQISAGALPLITVAMPIYNAGRYLRSAVLSVVSQTYTNWQLLIIDDGSTDNALETINDVHDDRIRIIKDGMNKGLAARLNEAIDLAEGEYFARMDHDDFSYPERFQKQVKALNDSADIDLICVRAVTISEANEMVGYLPYQLTHAEITAKPWRGFHMPHPTWMGRTVWFKRHRYSSDSPYFCEDQELLLRTYQVSRFSCIPEILLAYRLRAGNQLDKLRKIRCAVLKIQLSRFFASGQFKYAFLAVANFMGNILKDNLNAICGASYSPHKVSQIQTVDAHEFKKIQTIIEVNGG